MTHSILLTYRNRAPMLRAFLRTLATNEALNTAQLVIVDLGSSQKETEAIIHDNKGDISVDYHWIDYDGEFHKSKALNFGLSRINSDLATIVDVDCLFQKDWLNTINQFFAREENNDKKFGHRVRYIDFGKSREIMGNFALYAEWEKYLRLTKDSSLRLAYEQIDGIITGNSHLTMKAENMKALGGFDERFIGYAAEDTEFNLRCHANGIETVINEESTIYQLTHRYETDWHSTAAIKRNFAIYLESKRTGLAPLKIGPDWGKFNDC